MLILGFEASKSSLEPQVIAIGLSCLFLLRFLLIRFSYSAVDLNMKRYELNLSAISLYISCLLLVQVFFKEIFASNWILNLSSLASFILMLVIKSGNQHKDILSRGLKHGSMSSEIQIYLENLCWIKRKADKGDEQSRILISGVIDKAQVKIQGGDLSLLSLATASDSESRKGRIEQEQAFNRYVNWLYIKSIRR